MANLLNNLQFLSNSDKGVNSTVNLLLEHAEIIINLSMLKSRDDETIYKLSCGRMIRLHARPPPSPVNKLAPATNGKNVDEGGGRDARGAESYDRKKLAWSSINHSIFSGTEIDPCCA
jgi:hypothetical protein